MQLFLAAFAVAIVLLSALAAPEQTERSIVSTVASVGLEWMSVVSEQTDPMGLHLSLRDTAFYGPDGHPRDSAAIRPGVQVRRAANAAANVVASIAVEHSSVVGHRRWCSILPVAAVSAVSPTPTSTFRTPWCGFARPF